MKNTEKTMDKAAVDLRAGENKSSRLTKSDDLVHSLFGIFHFDFLPELSYKI